MTIDTVNVITLLVSLYAVIGVAVGVAFVMRVVNRVDSSATGAGLMFRLTILPAAAALWPVTLRLVARASASPAPHAVAGQEHGTVRPAAQDTGGTR